MKMKLLLKDFIRKNEGKIMSKKERNFEVELQEKSSSSWSVIVSFKKKSQTVAHITKLDQQNYEVEQLSNSVTSKVVTSSLEEALNSALIQFNLHLH